MGKRVLFVVTNHDQLGQTASKTGWHSSQLSHPLKLLTDAGHEVDFASPKGGKAPMSPSSENYDDPINAKFLLNPQLQARFDETLAVDQVNAADYGAVYFVGGHGAMWDFPRSPRLSELAADIYQAGGLVAAISHGVAALINAKLQDGTWLVSGKKMTGFSNEEEKVLKLHDVVPSLLETRLREHGAEYLQGDPWQPFVVEDGNLLTGQNAASANRLGELLLSKLG